jgi:urea transport system permease protein
VLLLMGLGLAIIFGQMGVINMAHGEFMTIGAYTIFLFSTLTETYAPGFDALLPVRDRRGVRHRLRARLARRVGADPAPVQAAARHAAGHLGPVARHAAGVPLDLRRQGGEPDAARLADGVVGTGRGSRHPDQRPVRDGADAAGDRRVLLALYRSRWGLRVRATVANRTMANAIGINTSAPTA